MRSLLFLIGMYSSALMATAAPTPPLPLPTMLSVFVCETVKGHHVEDMAKQGVSVMGAPNWVDLDWAYRDNLGVPMKVCERQYVSIKDKYANDIPVANRPIQVNPDASDPDQCAWLAMQIVGTMKDPGIIVGCPRAVYNPAGTIIAYTDPPCPPGCECTNEPEDL